MDGTILDTVDDLRASINYALDRCGHKHDFTREQCKELFGSGVHTALQRALSIEAGEQDQEILRLIGTPQRMTVPGIDEKEIERIEGVFRPYYLEHSMEHTGPYDGIMDLLRLSAAEVSKQPSSPTNRIPQCGSWLRNAEGLFDVSSRRTARHPEETCPDMTEEVMRLLTVSAGESLYLGDSEIDVQTALNTGMDCICVTWGFRSAELFWSRSILWRSFPPRRSSSLSFEFQISRPDPDAQSGRGLRS